MTVHPNHPHKRRVEPVERSQRNGGRVKTETIDLKMIKIVEETDHGKAVVATKRLEPGCFGLEVFTEKALVVFPVRGTEGDCSGPVPAILEPAPQLWTDWYFYQQQSQDLKDRILQLYTEMDCRMSDCRLPVCQVCKNKGSQ